VLKKTDTGRLIITDIHIDDFIGAQVPVPGRRLLCVFTACPRMRSSFKTPNTGLWVIWLSAVTGD